jgi:hypothetical protein
MPFSSGTPHSRRSFLSSIALPAVAGLAQTQNAMANSSNEASGSRPYVLDAVTMIVRIEDEVGKSERHHHVRTVYTVRAQKQIRSTDSVFREQYKAARPGRVEPWGGSNPERRDGDGYVVIIDLPAGSTQTIVTGADIIYDLQALKKAQEREFVWYYPNSDFTAQLVMVLESEGLGLKAVDNGAKRYPVGKPAITSNVTQKRDRGYGLFAQWRGLSPGEEVAIHYTT